MKRFAGILLLLLALLLGLAVALPFSEAGSRLLVAVASRVGPVAIDYGGGRLFGTFHLERFQLSLPSVTVELEDARANLDPGCLWRSEFCLRRLSAELLRVNVPPGGEGGEPDSGPPDRSALLLPVRVLAPRVALARTEVSWEGGSWRQGPAELALEVNSGGIYLRRGRVLEPVLSLEAGGDDADPGPVTLPALWLPFELGLDALELIRPGWHVAGAKDGLDSLELGATWSGERLAITRLAAGDGRWGELALEGELHFRDNWPLSAGASLVPGEALQWRSLAPGTLRVEAAGDLSQLSLALESDGEQRLEGRAELNVVDPSLPFSLQAGVSWDRPLALAQVAPVPEDFPPVQLTSPLDLSGEGSLATQSFTLAAGASGLGYRDLAIDLEAGHRDSTIEIRRLALREAGAAAAESLATGTDTDTGSGPGQGSALFANGELRLGETTAGELQVRTPGLALPALSDAVFGHLAGELDLALRVAPGAWSLALSALSLEGEVNGLPARARGDLALDSRDYIAGGDLQFDLNGARGRVRGAGEAGGATLELAVVDLGRWNGDSRGSLAASASLPAGGTTLDFKVDIDSAGWRDWQLPRAGASGRVDLARPEHFGVQLEGEGLNNGEGWFQESLAVAATGGDERLEGTLSTRGKITGELQLAARRENGQWRGTLQPAVLETPLGDWRLASPLAFSRRGESLQVADHCWRSGESSLCLEDLDLGPSGSAGLALAGSTELLAPLLSEGVAVAGSLSARGRARWGGGESPAAELRIEAGPGRLSRQLVEEGESASWHWEALEAGARYSEGALALEARLRRGDRAVLDLEAALPADRGQPLAGSVAVNRLDLAALKAFAPQLSQLAGTLDGDWELAGTVDRPLARGRLSLRDGAMTLVSSPTGLRDLSLDLDLRGDSLGIDGSGDLGGGPLKLAGELRSRPDWRLDLELSGEGNRLVYPPSLELVVSPDLRIEAGPAQVGLAGTIRVMEGTLEQEQLPAGSIGLSRDVVQVDYTGKPLRDGQPFATRMDVRVAIDDRFRVVGHGLDARVGGDLRVQQQPGRPLQLYGNLNVAGGEFRAYGQHLEVKRGRISFAGLPENPELDLSAERDIPLEKVTAGVRVAGTLEAPELTVYAEPPMPQTEALSYLVRGRGLDSGAGTDGTALALSLGTGVVNRSAVVEGLNSIPGLSGIEFGAEGSADDTAATVSGYIGERIYLSYGVGLYEPVNVLTARLYLHTSLWLEVVSRLESSVDLYYSFDID